MKHGTRGRGLRMTAIARPVQSVVSQPVTVRGEQVKINPHDPAYPLGHGMGGRADGLPIRLELASRFMGHLAAMPTRAENSTDQDATYALKMADALIAEYNKSRIE